MKIVSFVFLIIVLFSCSSDSIYRENIVIESTGWSKNKPVVFKPHISDTKNFFNTYVIVRHDGRYNFRNLFLFIKVDNPKGQSKTDTVECILADENGKWYGSGLGDIKTMKMAYRTKISFPDTGVYTFSIEQAMRNEPLEYINDVGFSIEKLNK